MKAFIRSSDVIQKLKIETELKNSNPAISGYGVNLMTVVHISALLNTLTMGPNILAVNKVYFLYCEVVVSHFIRILITYSPHY